MGQVGYGSEPGMVELSLLCFWPGRFLLFGLEHSESVQCLNLAYFGFGPR